MITKLINELNSPGNYNWGIQLVSKKSKMYKQDALFRYHMFDWHKSRMKAREDVKNKRRLVTIKSYEKTKILLKVNIYLEKNGRAANEYGRMNKWHTF